MSLFPVSQVTPLSIPHFDDRRKALHISDIETFFHPFPTPETLLLCHLEFIVHYQQNSLHPQSNLQIFLAPSHYDPIWHFSENTALSSFSYDEPSHTRSGSERGALLHPLRHFSILLPPFYFKSHVIAFQRSCLSIVTHLFPTISAPGSLALSIFS